MKIANTKYQKGHSLLEVILACSILAIIGMAFTVAVVDSQEANVIAGNYFEASMLAQEGIEAVRNIRDENFSNLQDGTYGLVINNNQWTLEGNSDITGIFSRQIVISTESNSTSTKNIASNVTWQQNLQRIGVITLQTRLTNWKGD